MYAKNIHIHMRILMILMMSILKQEVVHQVINLNNVHNHLTLIYLYKSHLC